MLFIYKLTERQNNWFSVDKQINYDTVAKNSGVGGMPGLFIQLLNYPAFGGIKRDGR
jgi:hypothetical protein